VIEFSHTNRFINGIAHCPFCNSVATQKAGFYKCKNTLCAEDGFEPIQNSYDQIDATSSSVNEIIGPLICENLGATFSTMQNDASTLLIIDFKLDSPYWIALTEHFGNSFHFHAGRIPTVVKSATPDNQAEFVNGLLDTAGFCNAGGWVPRKGQNSDIRQRFYFQIVKNWPLVVDIDNFMRKYFQTPIQTIDWGHPNIRDGNLTEALAGKTSAYAREHQIKIYPEYLNKFEFRISSKKAMFQELLNHNIEGNFTNAEDWFPPKRITTLRSHHPDEDNPRLPPEVRRHFDASWQLNLALGCEYLLELQSRAQVPDAFLLTGDLSDNRTLDQVLLDQSLARPVIPFELKKNPIVNRGSARVRATEELEFATYPILKEFYDAEYFHNRADEGEFYITSNLTLSSFIRDTNTDFLGIYDDLADHKIRPDLVGFDKLSKRIIFIESKVDVLDLRMVGQLLAYCLVANPEEAHLISTKPLSTRLLNTLSAGADILEYSEGRKIVIGRLNSNGVSNYDF
jgi:hypothetical protein